MAKERPFLATLNGGVVAIEALARIDLARMRFMAERMVNFTPKLLGSMQFRPGLGYQASTKNNLQARYLPFISSDTALIELTNLLARPIVNGATVDRVAVATAITNGDFSSATGWTLTSTGGSVCSISGGELTMNVTPRGSTALAKRSTAVAGGDLNKEHGLRLVVTRGPVTLRVGSSDGGDELINEATYGTGTYSLAFTPAASPFWVQLQPPAGVERPITVDSITIEAAGAVELPTPWPTANLRKCRYQQLGDTIFVANSSRLYQTRRIERRLTARSWGIILHEVLDGPFRGKTANLSMDPLIAGATNIGTLTASKPFFRASHVGSLFRLFHKDAVTLNVLSDQDQFGDAVQIGGFTTFERTFGYFISGTWVGTITLEVSYDGGLTWTSTGITRTTSTSPTVLTTALGAAGSTIHVRLGFRHGQYTSGTANVQIIYAGNTGVIGGGGGGWGILRVTSFVSSTVVNVEAIRPIKNLNALTVDWEEGKYSDLNGWPSALAFFDGRLWLGDNDKVAGSVSDTFDSLDVEELGDSGPIIRSIATGPIDKVYWMEGLGRLTIGTGISEPVARSTSEDGVLTPTNFSLKDGSTYGSADISAAKVDKEVVFIHRSGIAALSITYSNEAGDYETEEISLFNPDILAPGVVGVAIQRRPNLRFYFWLADGTVAVLLRQKKEDVIAWYKIVTDGIVEDIVVLPNTSGDDVYMTVARDVGGTKRYREKLAYDSQAIGGVNNFMADAYVTSNIVNTTTIGGATHLIGKSVVAWVNGSPELDASGNPALFVVNGAGQITIPVAKTGQAVIGLPYTGQWKSTKLAYGAQMGTAVSQPKIVKDLAPVLINTHLRGFRYGRDFDNLNDLPLNIRGEDKAFDTMLTDYDAAPLAFDGSWDTDARICIEARAPLPCTVLAIAGAVETHERG